MISSLIKELVHDFSKHPFFSDVDKELLKSFLESRLVQYDLVSRKEFDAQTKVLERTQQLLITLQRELKSFQNPSDL